MITRVLRGKKKNYGLPGWLRKLSIRLYFSSDLDLRALSSSPALGKGVCERKESRIPKRILI